METNASTPRVIRELSGRSQEAIRTVVDELPSELTGERAAVGTDNGLVSTASLGEIPQQRVLFRGMWLR
jgi:hypothetical protein